MKHLWVPIDRKTWVSGDLGLAPAYDALRDCLRPRGYEDDEIAWCVVKVMSACERGFLRLGGVQVEWYPGTMDGREVVFFNIYEHKGA